MRTGMVHDSMARNHEFPYVSKASLEDALEGSETSDIKLFRTETFNPTQGAKMYYNYCKIQ